MLPTTLYKNLKNLLIMDRVCTSGGVATITLKRTLKCHGFPSVSSISCCDDYAGDMNLANDVALDSTWRIPMTCKWLIIMVHKSPSRASRVVGPLPNGRTSWLTNGVDPNHLRDLGWSSKSVMFSNSIFKMQPFCTLFKMDGDFLLSTFQHSHGKSNMLMVFT